MCRLGTNNCYLLKVLRESEIAWKRLVAALGPFSHQLKLVAFDFDYGNEELYRSLEGVSLEMWAYSRGGLPRCVEKVMKII